MPNEPKNAINGIMQAIGTHLINSRMNYEDCIKQVLGPRNIDNRIKLEQIFQALQQCNVRLTIDERNFLTEWHRLAQDVQGTVSALTFLNDVGLPPQTMQIREHKKPSGRELSQNELIEA